MANVKISDLPAASTPLTGTELVPIVQSGVTSQTTVDALALDPLATSAGSSLVGYLPSGTSAVATTVQAKLRETVSVKDFGAVGDGVTDDTTAFVNACAAAVAAKKVLDISDCKLYLATQSASISSDGLFIQGSNAVSFFDMPTNNSLQTGNSAAFDTVKTQINAMQGSAIYSKYNGPIFTGQTFSGNKFTLMGFPGSVLSSGFKSTTPTAYPGWSIPFANLSDVSICYFGTHGLWALGGAEVHDINNIVSMNNSGYGLYIQQTSGVNSPIEYLNILGGAYARNFLGNVYLNGVSKQITIDGGVFNDAGQISRTGTLPTNESDIVYPIKIYAATSALIITAENITVQNCYAEQVQGLLRMGSPGPLFINTVFENNYIITEDNTKPYNHLALHDVYAYNLKTSNNYSPSPTKFWLETSANYYGLDFQELYERPSGAVTFTNYTPTELLQLVSRTRPANSGTLGDGTAATFAYDLTHTTTNANLSTVVITNTTGGFSCATSAYPLTVGTSITISGINTGTGNIIGYTNPTTYYIIATNGATTFTLSATLGGTAITTVAGTPATLTYNATFNAGANVTWASIGVNVASNFAVFLVTANFQSTTLDTIGGYLVYVTKMSSGNYAAIVQSTGTVTGFSSAPTLSTAGVLSIPLSANYRARVTRLDFTAIA